MEYLDEYLSLAMAIGVAGLFGAALLVASSVLGPKRRSAVKDAPFECGSTTVGSARQRFAVKFYVVGLLFIIFDLETVFFYPWAVQLHALGWFGFAEMFMFAVTLVVGLVYVWRRGALDWE